MKRTCAAALAALVLCGVSPAAAQDQLVTMFVPESQRLWDVTGFVGWRGVDKSAVAEDWNDWYDAAAFSATAGRYLTPHVKLEVDLSTTSTGRVFEETFVGTPGLPFYTLREHAFRRTTVGAMLAYQFLENRWVHPYLGVGAEGVRETEHLETQFVSPGVPRGGLAQETRVRHSVRPLVAGGVKFYVSERAFIRTDLISTFSKEGAESAVWRIGVGVDF